MNFICPESKITAVDILIIVSCILIVAASVFIPFTSNGSDKIEIISENNKQTVSLGENKTIELTSNGFSYVIEINDGQAFVAEADCPDLTCCKVSPIGHRQGSIICVPGNLVLRTVSEGGANNEADIIVP